MPSLINGLSHMGNEKGHHCPLGLVEKVGALEGRLELTIDGHTQLWEAVNKMREENSGMRAEIASLRTEVGMGFTAIKHAIADLATARQKASGSISVLTNQEAERRGAWRLASRAGAGTGILAGIVGLAYTLWQWGVSVLSHIKE